MKQLIKNFSGGFYGQKTTTTATKTKPKSETTAAAKTKSNFYKESNTKERPVLIGFAKTDSCYRAIVLDRADHSLFQGMI